MVYFILVTGLVIIYIALKKGHKRSHNYDFNDIFKQKSNTNSIDSLIAKVNELNERVDELESAFLLYKPDFNSSISKAVEISVSEASALDSSESAAKETPQDIIKLSENDSDNYNINKQIYSLYDKGNSIEEIASLLRIGKGEVSLRLGLRKPKI